MTTDRMETIIAVALETAGFEFTTPAQRHDASGLDFRLANGVEIEVKRMHSPRIAAQMASAENVIAVQGEAAVRFLASVLDERRRNSDLRDALSDLLRCEYEAAGHGLTDCVDNDGAPYQSAHLGGCIKRAETLIATAIRSPH